MLAAFLESCEYALVIMVHQISSVFLGCPNKDHVISLTNADAENFMLVNSI